MLREWRRAGANIVIADALRWCQPCRVLTPLLKEVTEPGTGYDLLTINVDEHPDLAGQFKVSAAVLFSQLSCLIAVTLFLALA